VDPCPQLCGFPDDEGSAGYENEGAEKSMKQTQATRRKGIFELAGMIVFDYFLVPVASDSCATA
jgi:hypothetical protein